MNNPYTDFPSNIGGSYKTNKRKEKILGLIIGILSPLVAISLALGFIWVSAIILGSI